MALQSAHGRFLIIRNCSDSRRQVNLGFSTNNGSVVLKESNKLKWLKLNGNQTKNTSIGELEEKGLTGFGNVVNGSNGSVKESAIDKVGNGSNGSIGDVKKVSNRSNGSFIDFKKAVNGSNGSFKDFKKVSNRSNGSLKDYKKVINGSNGSVKDYEINMVSNGPNGSLKYFKKIINGSNGSIKGSKTDKVVNGSNGSLKDSEIKPRDALEKQFNLSNNQEENVRERLLRVYNEVLVIDNIKEAKRVVKLLTTKYKDFIHGCDTEVANIDVKQETPVNHGELICFSIYSCNNGIQADFGNEKSCIWVDILDGEKNLLKEFIPFFEDPSIKKVWHNYSFDSHIIENYDINLKGFHADTMHLARLWDSSRRLDGGYSLEALSGDSRVISNNIISPKNALNIGKISMKSIFGKKKLKKDGTEGKIIIMDPVENLQRENRELWISYSSLDSISTLRLYLSLKEKLENMNWVLEGCNMGSMYDFYREYWGPFGEILVKMETQGMLVDRIYLANIEKIAIKEQKLAQEKFKNWASGYCEDAKFMNVGSDAQIRQLFFGGIKNNKNPEETLPLERTFKIPNTDKIIENNKKAPAKTRNITLRNLVQNMQPESFTLSGWPSVSGPALKSLAGPIPPHLIYKQEITGDDWTGDGWTGEDTGEGWTGEEEVKYGSAFKAFGGGRKGKEACCAIAALCEVCSIDSLISNFILPLQGNHISCDKGRIHCSLNINTETGRLSARAPNLQNQPALEKDRYKIRQAFVAAPGNSLIVADYGQLELRILAHLAKCKSMLDAFKAGGDFHSRTAMNMYDHVRKAVEQNRVLLEWYPIPGQEKPPVPLLKDAFGSERRKAKMLNFSIAYGKTPMGLARDWKVSVKEAKETVKLWYKERQEVLRWQEQRKRQALETGCVHTLLGRARKFPSLAQCSPAQRGHIERAAINTPVQGSAADVAMCAMIEIDRNKKLKELGWKLLLQVHDEVILEGPTESAELAKSIVVECMSKPFYGANILNVDLSVDAKCAQNWYAAK